MGVKEIRVKKGGLNATLELEGEKYQMGGFKDEREMANAQSLLMSVLTEHFFELSDMNAKRENKEIFEYFKNEKEMVECFGDYASGMFEEFVKIGALHLRANWELFKAQRSAKGIVDKNEA